MSLSHFKGGLKSVPRQLFRCNHMGKYFKKKFKNIQCKVMGDKKNESVTRGDPWWASLVM